MNKEWLKGLVVELFNVLEDKFKGNFIVELALPLVERTILRYLDTPEADAMLKAQALKAEKTETA